jgi:hypothetical protein
MSLSVGIEIYNIRIFDNSRTILYIPPELLFNKKFIVNSIKTKIVNISFNKTRSEYYIDVTYLNNLIYIPLCAMVICEPDYSPKKLIKSISNEYLHENF